MNKLESDFLSAQEVASILKIARNTVYELIKRGELPSARVGKQVRITRQDVETYLTRGKSSPTPTVAPLSPQFAAKLPAQDRDAVITYPQPFAENPRGNEFIICGQDISIDILINHLNMVTDILRIYRSYLGSYNGIYALYQGHVNVATTHLWDGDLDEYNIPYVKKMMPGIPALIVRIGERQHGFYIKRGNPKGVTGWEDLKRRDIVIVNREKGSGTRVLIDEKLRLMGMDGEAVQGYSSEYKSHLAAATVVSQGQADIAVGSETGCKNVRDIKFIPLQTECYDLIIRKADAAKQPYRKILDIVTSKGYRMDLENIGGFNTRETGRILQ
ncbi:helix-turn-helix transcriptional regulator [Treponema primitia]|uniref:helix-turn-helix transcriptional regulator n=1 Tax=Treponema primitia TaxID=88058 RepID=UPI00056F8C7A|nr:helix-turn-helix transcriptional regulator [Treponema primitia]